jgi:hypothetical protein
MEVYSSSYKLSKDNKEYILTLSIMENSIRITCRSALNETALNFTRDFTIEDLKSLNQMFINVNTPTEALQAIDQALKMEKVDIVEEGENLQIKFYITQKGAHVIENAQTVTTDYNTFSQTNEAYQYNESANENYDLNQNFNFQQGNTYQDSVPIEGAVNENATPYLDALNTETLNLNINSNEGYTDYSNLEYQTGTENLTDQYIGTNQAYTETTNTYLGGTNTQYENNFNEYESSTPVNYNLPIEDTTNNQYLQSFQETTQTVETVNQYTQPSTNFEGPYIQPADDLNQYTEPVQTDQNYQEYTATNVEEKPDDKINQLEGATSNLKNDHQLIQDQLNSLSNQINSYKDQLTLMEKGKEDDEISQLRAENKIIKQQLNELNSLRNDAAEVKFLRSQMEELISLRKKVAEMEVLKGQLGELNTLRAKVAKLDSVKAQCAEINNLRNQVSQMNMMKQQLGELDELKAKVAELSGVQSQLGELNRLRAQVGQVEVLKSQLDELTKLKSNAGDLDELRRKIEELENIKSQYEFEIKILREGKSSSEQSKLVHETKLRSAGMESKQLYFEDKPEQICVKGEIIHNTDELELLTRKINKKNQKLTLTLLYKASADSDKASVFHEKCDEAKGSLVLVETDKGKRFGGYTSCSWSGDCIDKKDENAFVFSLDKMEIYDNIPGEDAIGCYPKFGPIFLGCQIRIYDNAFTKGGTTFEKGLNFNTEEDFELTGGDRIFNVKDIEVYEVIAQ